MSHTDNSDITRDEIKKEFQLERMILFSDAVFAIVITLMAIEIHLPETVTPLTGDTFLHEMKHLIPVFISYAVSFFFIGMVWYQHLKIFSLLKTYDKGLVIRNLILLFFVGLFPFSSSVVTRVKGTPMAFYFYAATLFCCLLIQYLLHRYIVVEKPALRFQTELTQHNKELKEKRIALVAFALAILLIMITQYLITDPELKTLGLLWMMLLPVAIRFIRKRSNGAVKAS